MCRSTRPRVARGLPKGLVSICVGTEDLTDRIDHLYEVWLEAGATGWTPTRSFPNAQVLRWPDRLAHCHPGLYAQCPPSPLLGRALSPNTGQSSDTLANEMLVGLVTPTGRVVVPGRDWSGTVVGRPPWDDAPQPWQGAARQAPVHAP